MSVFLNLSAEARAELWACLALRHCKGIGVTRARTLVHAYGTAYEAVQLCLAAPGKWRQVGIPARTCNEFVAQHWRKGALHEWQALQQEECSFLLWNDPHYPELLHDVADAPLLLYYRGDVSLLHNPTVSVVGARACSKEGMRMAAFFARELSAAGVTIISGMAKGIDRVAHIAGMEGCGRSIAVLGTGINVIYPASNSDLAHLLGNTGLILSEFAPDTKAAPSHFPIRNRLISGLSRGVLVIEAAQRSGSLITARLALEQGREVFAVPGQPLSPEFSGCQDLIRHGAKPVFHADDILIELAPLLQIDAVRALNKSMGSTDKALAKAKLSAKYPYFDELAGAQGLSSEGGLPWIAPPQKRMADVAGILPIKTHSNVDRQAVAPQEVAKSMPAQENKALLELTDQEQRIVHAMATEEIHIDALCRSLAMDVATLSPLLTLLEVRGLIKRRPGMFYSCTG